MVRGPASPASLLLACALAGALLCGCGSSSGGGGSKSTARAAVANACTGIQTRVNETVAQTIGISTVSPHKVYERQYRAGVQQAAAALESVIHELASNPGALTDSEPLARELTALAASFHRVGTEKASTSLREKASKVGVLLDEAESDCTAALKRL